MPESPFVSPMHSGFFIFLQRTFVDCQANESSQNQVRLDSVHEPGMGPSLCSATDQMPVLTRIQGTDRFAEIMELTSDRLRLQVIDTDLIVVCNPAKISGSQYAMSTSSQDRQAVLGVQRSSEVNSCQPSLGSTLSRR